MTSIRWPHLGSSRLAEHRRWASDAKFFAIEAGIFGNRGIAVGTEFISPAVADVPAKARSTGDRVFQRAVRAPDLLRCCAGTERCHS